MPFDRPLLWACRALALSAGLSACGGLAADGLESNAIVPGESTNVDEPTFAGPVRETCEDNPLLAGCPYTSTGGNSPPPQEVQGPSSDEEPLYIAAARNILVSYCGGCHGSALTELQASGAINYIDDWDKLIEAGLIERCSPRRSRIIQVMSRGEMPPAESGLPVVTDADIGFVEQAIELDCNTR